VAVAVIVCSAPRASARNVERLRPSAHSDARRAHGVSARIEARPKDDLPSHVAPDSKHLLPSRHATQGHGTERSGASVAKRVLPPPRPLRPIRAVPSNASWRAFRKRPWERGYVTLFGHGKKWSGYLVDKYGDVIPASRKSLSSVLGSWRTGKQMLIDDRLLALVADASDEFGGRPIRIVSGYREHSYAPDSRHKTGEAFDFSIPDVPNEAVRDFLRSLPDVGVGYYPNSTHVHLDVRDKPTYWVDYSRPGDRPIYSWDRRVAGFTPAERALAAALDSIVSHARETIPATVDREGHEAPHPLVRRPEARHDGHAATFTDRDDAEDEHEEDAEEHAVVNSAHTAPSDAPLPRTPPAAAIVRR
jgi:hypothetical protein